MTFLDAKASDIDDSYVTLAQLQSVLLELRCALSDVHIILQTAVRGS